MNIIRAISFKLRALFDRRALDSELDAELSDHVDRETRANISRGMTPGEARRVALAAFGSVQHYKEETREARGASRIEYALDDIRYALRALRKSPAFTATVVITLALGVGANSAVFSILNRIYLRQPGGVAQPGEMRRVYQRLPADHPYNGDHKLMFIPRLDWLTFSGVSGAMGAKSGRGELIAYTTSDSIGIARAEGNIPTRKASVTDNYFSVLRVPMARGRAFAAGEGDPAHNSGVAVISFALWQNGFFGDEGIVGREISVNKKPYVIIGVAAKDFSGTELNRTDLFLPLGALSERTSQGKPWYATPMGDILHVMVRLPNGNDAAFTSIATVVNRRFGADLRGQQPPGTMPDTSSTIVTGPIIEALGPGANPKEYAIGIRLAGVAAIVLLIACANIANLLLVRAVQRQHEIAVRVALGVSRARLMAQFLTEGIILSLLGAGAAILVAIWGGAVLRALILPYTRWATSAFDAQVLAFTLTVAMLTGIAAALLPALRGSRVDIVFSLKPGSRGTGGHRSRARSLLLATQTALSVVLLVGAGLFVRSLRELHALPIGYVADELAFASVNFDGPGSHQAERLTGLPRAAERIAALPGVRGVALAESAPMQGAAFRSVFIPGRDSAVFPSFNTVSPEFFTVTGMRIVAGRTLGADDRRGEGGSLVVNEAMAKAYWPGESPLGKCVRINKDTAGCSLVVGVAEDGRQMRIMEDHPSPQYFVPLRAMVDSESTAPRAILIRTQAGGAPALQEIARSELKRQVPAASEVEYRTMAQALAPELRPWRLGAYLFTAFGMLALLVATVGVYGVIAYSFSQREHELGVRVALGASTADTYRLVLGESLRLTAIGVVAGVALALASGRLVASLLYATSPKDPAVIGGAVAALTVAALCASVIPAWRATRTDPMEALRAE